MELFTSQMPFLSPNRVEVLKAEDLELVTVHILLYVELTLVKIILHCSVVAIDTLELDGALLYIVPGFLPGFLCVE